MRFSVQLLLLCILGTTIALDANQEIIQKGLNGIFEQNNLVDPQTVMACIDSETAANIVAFAPKFFKDASSILTIYSAITKTEEFFKTMKPEVMTCLKENNEMIALVADFDVSKVNKATALSYLATHISSFTNEFSNAYKEFTSGNYNQLGNELSAFTHKILNSVSKVLLQLVVPSNDANQDILQQVINGFYEQNKLADPTTVIACVDSDSAAKIVAFIPTFLKKASSLITITGAISSIQPFINSLNPQIATCLKGNAEGAELATVFDITGITQQAAISWATGHLSAITGEASTLNKVWTAAQYNQFGNNGSSFAHDVIKQISGKSLLTSLGDANQDILQQVVNGFYEQNKLADPTTIIACVDSDSAAKIVAFIPTFLKKASSLITITGAISSIQPFINSLNPQIATCLKGNAEGAELATVFDITGITQQAAISWATGHLSAITGEASTLNKVWTAAQYNQFGNNGSSFAHDVIKQISGKSFNNSQQQEIM